MKKIVLFLCSITLLLAQTPAFLMPDEAFIPHAKLNESMQIEASVEIAKDIYLYADKLTFEVKGTSGISVKEVQSPESVNHDGDKAYMQTPHFLVSLKKDANVSGVLNIQFEISYQGCSEKGLCYEPLSKTYSFDINTSKLNIQEIQETKKIAQLPQPQELSQTDAIADTISSGSIGLILLTFFGFGLLLSLTPCVFPMIPIISGVIMAQGEGLTTKRAFFLSLVYVLAMAVAYTIAGVLAGLFGSNLQAALQTPWVIYTFAAIFVALAMSMFGFYELRPPSFLLTSVSGTRKEKGVLGVAVMGFLSALIVGPCVAAPLAGALVYIGQTGDALLGGMALFVMSIGMGVPLIIVGVSAGKFMPKPGHWMVMVMSIFGVMMLGVAIWMLERVVDAYVTMLLWAMLGMSFAIYLGAFEKEIHIFRKSIGVIILIYSVALFIGTLGGSNSMAKPLEFLKPQTAIAYTGEKSRHVEFIKISSIQELENVLLKNKGKAVMLDFYADWCTACKEFESITFANEDVRKKMDGFVLIQADLTLNGENEKALSKKYGIFGPPAIIFFDNNTQVIASKTIVGFMEPEKFLAHLNTI